MKEIPPFIQPQRALIAIDPGKHHCGYALFGDGALLHAGLARTEPMGAWPVEAPTYRQGSQRAASTDLSVRVMRNVRALSLLVAPAPVDVVAELPVVYVDKRRTLQTRSDPNDLLYLAFTAGVCMGEIDAVSQFQDLRFRLVLPSEWKGQVPPAIMWQRIRAKLSPAEVDVARAGRVFDETDRATFHHGLEAIGIGLWAQWRL